MTRMLLCVVALGIVVVVADARAVKNDRGLWALHYAGVHDPQANSCDTVFASAMDLVVDAPGGPGRCDIYVIAIQVDGIAESRFGLTCTGSFVFYGWTPCSDSEDPGAGWPGCDAGVSLNWASEQVGPNVTMGILDVYVYGGASRLCISPDPRIGRAGWCDGSTPTAICVQTKDQCAFGCVGFGGTTGYNPFDCVPVPVDNATWGSVKALYR